MSYYQKLFWVLTSVTTFIRLLIIGHIGITVDEAHYWVYSKFLDLSYYDHPPLIGYIVKLFTAIFGVNEFAVRFPSVIIFILTSWVFFLSAKKLFNEKTAFVGTVLLNILPVFSFLGAVVTIPDSPLSLFWMLSFYLFINIIETSKKNYWYLLGFVIGFAFLSKYTAVMIFPSIMLFLLFSKQHRFWFLKKELYFSILIAFICFIPVILWNLENNWASFGFQMQHGFGNSLPKFSI
ncbi:MAG: glycosyltransferase family 39 protein, partial [Endomicrobiaceae bacterium]